MLIVSRGCFYRLSLQ